MAVRDKASVVKWFKGHQGKEIVITSRGSALRLQGRTTGVQSLDACSAEFEESTLELDGEGLHVALTFHGENLGVHCLAYRPGGKEVSLSMAASIPYASLRLSTPDKENKGKKSSGRQSEEPEFSPYELLH